MPQSTDAGFIQNLMQILSGGNVPYSVAQTQVEGVNKQSQQSIADMIAAALGTSQQTLGVGSGGSTGLLGGLVGGLSGNSGIASMLAGLFGGGGTGTLDALDEAALGSVFSDRRLKDDLEQVGEVVGFPLYKYRYKGESRPRLGLVAQDVEKRLPRAVGESHGYKTVDYATVLEHIFAEAA
jgi:hypothetical protein